MNALTNETIQEWIEEESYASAPVRGKRIVELGTELLRARKTLGQVASGLDRALAVIENLTGLEAAEKRAEP